MTKIDTVIGVWEEMDYGFDEAGRPMLYGGLSTADGSGVSFPFDGIDITFLRRLLRAFDVSSIKELNGKEALMLRAEENGMMVPFLVVSANGIGKRFDIQEWRDQKKREAAFYEKMGIKVGPQIT